MNEKLIVDMRARLWRFAHDARTMMDRPLAECVVAARLAQVQP